jgi:50S ribosomal protein uL3
MEQTEKQIIKGIKQEMSQIFSETGLMITVTKVLCSTDLTEDLANKDIAVTGTSKGKGWAGAMKKWGFHGEQATRGQSTKPRSAGAVGGQTPGRVLKGKKMAGRMGNDTVTIKGLKIVGLNIEKKELLVSGPVPGSRNSALNIRIVGGQK